jgi:hypothetical protein
MRPVLPLIVLAAVLMTGSAEAFTVLGGQGALSCGSWTSARRDRTASGPQQWVLGFLLGVGWALTDSGWNPLKGVDADGVWAWVDNYCQAHPLQYLAEAAGAFAREHPR